MLVLTELLIIALMLAINAVLACYEMALASVSRARIEVLLHAGRRGARSAARMKDRLEGSLAVVQLGITLAGAIAAATGGVGVDEKLSPWLAQALVVSPATADTLALALLVLPLSAVTIVFAELIPKMVGIRNKEGVVLALSPTIRGLAVVFHPLIALFEGVVKGLMRAFGGKVEGAGADHVGLLELRAAAALARATRVIGPMEERIVVAAVQLSARRVTEAMVPVADIATIPAESSLVEALIQAHLHMHTRYPVSGAADGPQSISGYVTFKDIVTALKMDPTGAGLKGIVRPLRRLEASVTLAQALNEMIRDRVHIALVMEGAVVKGLITMEDIVEELVGDIHDEYDRLPTHMHALAGGWLVGGGVPLGELVQAMKAALPAGAEARQTLADWVDAVQRKSAHSGDVVRVGAWEAQVRKARRNRVSEALVRVVEVSGAPPHDAPLVR